MVIGAFLATDVLLFYILFEAMLIPMYFLIGIWGSARRLYAAIKFFLYTLVGSVLMLIAMIALYLTAEPHTFNIVTLTELGRDEEALELLDGALAESKKAGHMP